MIDRGVADRAQAGRQSAQPQPRLAEAAAALAVACDLATGMPLTMSLRTCLAALRLADLLDDQSLDRSSVYYLSLVKLLGCTVESSRFGAAMGNEHEISRAMAPVDMGAPLEMLAVVLRSVGAGEPPLTRVRMLAQAMSFGAGMRSVMAGHCEVSRMLAGELRLDREVIHGLDFTYERWDGKGAPKGVRGEAVPLINRVGYAAYQAVVQDAFGGVERVRAVAEKRAGGALDPRIATLLAAHADDVLEAANVESPWEAVMAAEPGPTRPLDEAQKDATVTAMACFTDLKSDTLAGHSTGVARTAEAAANLSGMDGAAVRTVKRAALMHDLGRVGVSSRIWDKPGRLTDDEWEEVRLHAYHLERAVGRVPWLAAALDVAAKHHERLDGRGYHRGSRGADLSVAARLVAAADCYHALLEPRRHRAAHARHDAARILEGEAADGRLDREAVRCVLEAAGHSVRRRRELPDGLTEREVEVLRVIARGLTMRQAAQQLHVSPKTIDTHVQHIYGKVGCTTRSGAAVYAMREGLLDPAGQ